MLKTQLKSKFEELKNDPSSPIYRVIAGLLTSLVISTYPVFIFLIYMRENGFYSYDIIGEGFSLNTFFFANFLLILFTSLLLMGSVFTTLITWKNQRLANKNNKEAWLDAFTSNAPFITLNILLLGIFIYLMVKDNYNFIHIFILVSSIIIVLLLSSLAVAPASLYFKVVVLTMGLMYTFPLFNSEKSSVLLADGLKFFGSGNKEISVKSTDLQAPYELKGDLIFLSPKFIYIRKSPEKNDEIDCSNIDTCKKENLVIIPRRETLIITYL